jgi:hypothetical protein
VAGKGLVAPFQKLYHGETDVLRVHLLSTLLTPELCHDFTWNDILSLFRNKETGISSAMEEFSNPR